jgi:hypothetical protein
VKVLDLGLAKHEARGAGGADRAGGSGGVADMARSPTQMMGPTGEGVLLGGLATGVR